MSDVMSSGTSGFGILGTGGVPNLRIVEDHATKPESAWFEVHTAIRIPHPSVTVIRDALAAGDYDIVIGELMRSGELAPGVDTARLIALLRAALYRL